MMAFHRPAACNVILIGGAALAATVAMPSHAQQAPLNLSIPQTTANAGQAEDWSVHAQYTFVGQGYPQFHSAYQGPTDQIGAGVVARTAARDESIPIERAVSGPRLLRWRSQ